MSSVLPLDIIAISHTMGYLSFLQSTETTSSSAMELYGLKQCRKVLEDNNLSVSRLTTDRHISINKYVREEWQEVDHFFDVWHIAKGKVCAEYIIISLCG